MHEEKGQQDFIFLTRDHYHDSIGWRSSTLRQTFIAESVEVQLR